MTNRFAAEIRLLSSLKHPHIVKLLGASTYEGQTAMVLEYAKLGELAAYVRRPPHQLLAPGHISRADVLCIAVQIAGALQFLESMKVIHRDVAARNVLAFSMTTFKLADVGLSRLLGSDQEYYRQESQQATAIRWMAPEAMVKHRFSSQSDVWSFGILLYEACTYGSVPYGHLSDMQVPMAVTRGVLPPEPPTRFPELYAIMGMCWRSEPAQRPTFAQ
ncbi:uncharacterized protein MONBRDRAFT_16001, partial [Monosiga brevicollis MX1]